MLLKPAPRFVSGCIQIRKPFDPKDAVSVVGRAIGNCGE
jgi:hypothetical protein